MTALRRCDVAPDASWVRVTVAHTEVAGRGIVVDPHRPRTQPDDDGAAGASVPVG